MTFPGQFSRIELLLRWRIVPWPYLVNLSRCRRIVFEMRATVRASVWRGLVIAALLSLGTQCKAPKKNYGRKPPRNFSKVIGSLAPGRIQDSLATPPHNFSRSEYPFDAQGNYREDWVRSSGASKRRSGSSTSMKPNSNGSMRYHVVRRGDTLFSLSRRYGVTLYSIRRENGLDSFTIRVGQVLRMPASKN